MPFFCRAVGFKAKLDFCEHLEISDLVIVKKYHAVTCCHLRPMFIV